MKNLCLTLVVLMTASTGFAKFSCQMDDRKLVVDPDHKRMVLTKDGKPHRFKILNPANHGFLMFGRTSKAFEIEGGLVVGIKDAKDGKTKELSIFQQGEAIASFNDCTEK